MDTSTGRQPDVDRPPIRRGRHGTSAEAVSVADLLARTAPAEKANVSAIQERGAAEASAYGPGPGDTDDSQAPAETTGSLLPAVIDPVDMAVEPRTSHRLARTIMFATTTMLLCGVVAAFSVLGGEGSDRLVPSTPMIGPGKIDGPTVVRPDLLDRQLAGGLLDPAQIPSPPAGPPPVSPSGGSLQPQDEARAALLVDVGPEVDSSGSAPEAEEVRNFVRLFFESLEAHPDRSYDLLGPEMRGDSRELFIRSWASVIVEVPQLEGGDGGVVRAVVTIAWPDATLLRTEQLLVVSDGPSPKIVRAELLSAHRG